MPTQHTARGIVAKDNHILLLERWRIDVDGSRLHYFSIPGGRLEKAETPEAAVVREVLEETSCLVRPQQKIATQTWQAVKQDYFICQYLSGEPESGPTEENTLEDSALPQWVARDDIADLPLHKSFEPLRQLLIDICDNHVPDTQIVLQ